MSGVVTIPAGLVRFLRNGVRNELAARVGALAIVLERPLDQASYEQAITGFDLARNLLDAVGLADEKPSRDLDLKHSPLLVLKALEREHQAEVQRVQDAQFQGLDLPEGDISVLGSFIATLRREQGVSPNTSRQQDSFFEKHVTRARRRKRGDG